MNITHYKKSKKKQKILIQIGALIIILFTGVSLAVGNMITMSSFSTSLSSNLSMFELYMETINENMNEYKAMPWLLAYWRDNAENLLQEEEGSEVSGDISDILKRLSKDEAEEVTVEEAKALSADEQKRFAVRCYIDMQSLFTHFKDEDKYTVILTSHRDSDNEQVVIYNSQDGSDQTYLGGEVDLDLVKQVTEDTSAAIHAEVWRWAFFTPDKSMIFATTIPYRGSDGSVLGEMYGAIMADIVYDDMLFTDHIRNDVIRMMLVMLILILTVLYFIVPRPLSMVQKCVSEYSDTKDTQALVQKLSAIHSQNEIGAFADEFSALALEMERYNREMEVLAGERERVATELNVANNIQMQMLPQVFPAGKEFSVYASMEPAKEVGGDFYDCYMIDDDHLAMIVADVSGKGVPAALFMAVSKTMLKNRTIVGGSPAEILHDVNNWLSEGNDNCMFVTVWLGILTLSTGELICANAGHENPAIRSGDEGFRLIRNEHGSVLGVMENMEFNDEHYHLSAGDAIFIYTDGVPEANAADESLFGEERLEAVLSQVTEGDSPQMIMQKVRKAVDEFANGTSQYDDLTMLCLVMAPSD